jgi:hypothetical protein
MPPRFDDRIAFDGTRVIALGPLDDVEKIKEVCAWVYQSSDDRQKDAAATEMTTNRAPGEGRAFFRQTSGRWLLELTKLEDDTTTFEAGVAFAVAVALITDPNGRNRVLWWGHPVVLVDSSSYAEAASAFFQATEATMDDTSSVDAFTPPLDFPVAAAPSRPVRV